MTDPTEQVWHYTEQCIQEIKDAMLDVAADFGSDMCDDAEHDVVISIAGNYSADIRAEVYRRYGIERAA